MCSRGNWNLKQNKLLSWKINLKNTKWMRGSEICQWSAVSAPFFPPSCWKFGNNALTELIFGRLFLDLGKWEWVPRGPILYVHENLLSLFPKTFPLWWPSSGQMFFTFQTVTSISLTLKNLNNWIILPVLKKLTKSSFFL